MGRRQAERPFATVFLSFWLPVLLYVALIFVLSTQPNLKPPFAFQFGDKLAHLLEYGGLGLLLGRAVFASARGASPPVVALIALCIGILVGTGDELIQASVPGRQSSGFDLMADTVGVGLAQLLVRALTRG